MHLVWATATGKRPNLRRLVHHQQQGPVPSEGGGDAEQFRLVLGKCPMQQLLAVAIQLNGVAVALADIDADQQDDAMVFFDQAASRHSVVMTVLRLSFGGKFGIHVTAEPAG
jgi:hypothetical protein